MPPFLVLDHLALCLTDVERFGPAATETTELDWVAKNLFANNVRQNVIVGDKLDWYEGSTRLIRAAGRRLCGADGTGPELLEQSEHVWKTYLGSLRVMSVDEYRSRHSLRDNKSWLGGEPSVARRRVPLDENWYSFSEQLKQLNVQLKTIVAEGLKDGHILMSEDLGSTSRLVHPSSAKVRSAIGGKRYAYCFAGDLPKSWLDTFQTLPKRRLRAAKWMIRAHNKIHKDGKRVTRIQLIDVAIGRYKLKPNAASDAWDIARRDLQVSKGDLTDNARVDTSEINKIR
jgi:hypothetical protein